MSEEATTRVDAGNRVSRPNRRRRGDRGRGVGGDRERGVPGPERTTYGAPIEEVLAYHADNRGPVAIAVGQEALNLPLLLLFVTGLHGLVERRGAAGADWSRLAVAAGATFSAVIGVLRRAVGSASCSPPASSPSRALCWSSPGRSMQQRSRWRCRRSAPPSSARRWPTHASGLTPPWQRLLGVVGGSLLIAAGTANLAIADGSALLFVGLAGLGCLARLAVATGLRLVRGQG